MANIRKVYKLTVPLTDALHKRLASLAAKQGRTMAGLVRWWVDRGEAHASSPTVTTDDARGQCERCKMLHSVKYLNGDCSDPSCGGRVIHAR